jgi:hypothetical protein
MPRDENYSPFGKSEAAQLKPREVLWHVRAGHTPWSCELLLHGAYGVGVQLFRDTQFFAGRRFDTRAMAEQWAPLERESIERDGVP